MLRGHADGVPNPDSEVQKIFLEEVAPEQTDLDEKEEE
jgi:hypothetical protein